MWFLDMLVDVVTLVMFDVLCKIRYCVKIIVDPMFVMIIWQCSYLFMETILIMTIRIHTQMNSVNHQNTKDLHLARTS